MRRFVFCVCACVFLTVWSRWDGLGVTNEVRTVLNANIRSLFFNGQYDLICNHVSFFALRFRLLISERKKHVTRF